MARIKLKIGENEIEVDSRDFYVDNQTLGEIIENITSHLPENQAKIVYETECQNHSKRINNSIWFRIHLMMLKHLNLNLMNQNTLLLMKLNLNLRILETSKFFDSPRTVTETVEQLKRIWMGCKSIRCFKSFSKNGIKQRNYEKFYENRTHYFVEEAN